MNSGLYISLEDAVFELIKMVGDEDSQNGIPEGDYYSYVMDAIRFFEENSIYEVRSKDVDVITGANIIDLPKGAFDIRMLFLLDSSSNQFTNVNIKRNLINNNNFQTANNLAGNRNIYMNFLTGYRNSTSCIVAGNIFKGQLHLLDEVSGSYNKLRVVYRGLSEDSKCACIPLEAKAGIVDHAAMNVFNKLKVRDRQRRIDYQDAYQRFYGGNNRRDVGSFTLTKRFFATLSHIEREAIKEYLTNAKYYA